MNYPRVNLYRKRRPQLSAAYIIGVLPFLLLPAAWSLAFAETNDHGSGAVTDFVDFWAAARLLINGGNPFSPSEVLALQKSVGFTDSKPLLLWNPPWTLSFILPFGAMDFRVGQFIWLLMHVFFTLLSAQMLWTIYNCKGEKGYLSWLTALSLIPTWFVLILGQISVLVLLGIAGFLYFEKRRNWFLAGVTAILTSTKPHLVYLFWLALFLWMLHRRRWSLALGAILAGIIVAAIPLFISPTVYSDFLEMYRNPGRTTPFELPAPSLGSWLTLSLSQPHILVQFLPPLLGTLWFLWYWMHKKEHWDWPEQMPLLLLVSATMTAYAWTYDYVILLPAAIHGLNLVRNRSARWLNDAAVVSYLAINALYLGLKLVVVSDYYYVWLAPAYLLYLRARLSTSSTEIQPA